MKRYFRILLRMLVFHCEWSHVSPSLLRTHLLIHLLPHIFVLVSHETQACAWIPRIVVVVAGRQPCDFLWPITISANSSWKQFIFFLRAENLFLDHLPNHGKVIKLKWSCRRRKNIKCSTHMIAILAKYNQHTQRARQHHHEPILEENIVL